MTWYNSTSNLLKYYNGTITIPMISTYALDPNGGLEMYVGMLRIKPDFGDGSDGDVIISSNTSLTRDTFYNNLTINNGITLNPNGYRIFVKDTLSCIGTGKFLQNGGDGGNGTSAINGVNGQGGPTYGGAAGTPPYTSASLPMLISADGKGADGAYHNSSGGGNGNVSSLTNVGKSYIITGSKGGNGGNANTATGGVTPSISPARKMRYLRGTELINFARTFIDSSENTIEFVYAGNARSGGCTGAVYGGTNDNGTSGGGGGAGAHAGFMCISARIINNLNIDSKGGKGGNAGSPGFWDNDSYVAVGGSGGGAGGNGGVVFVFYGERNGTESITLTGGLGGTKSNCITTNYGGTNGTDGDAGQSGLLVSLQIY
jgi:hypothetical protein